MYKQPLVSIIIPTYNSSQYVCETMDSAINQTYKNIEIIITDDCSTDNTVEVCRQWIEQNKKKGIPLKLIETTTNTGVSCNANRGFKSSNGEWIKFIAGDDILAPNAITAYVDFVLAHPNVKHFMACAVHFVGDFSEDALSTSDRISQYMYEDHVTPQRQFSVLTKTFFGSGPTYFIHGETMRSLGGFDERFNMQEDYPLFIKMVGLGHKILYMDYVTVYKRIVPTSIQYDKNADDIFPKNKVRMICEWKYQYKMEVLSPMWRLFLRYSLWLQQLIIKQGNSRKSVVCRILNFVDKVTDPFIWCDRWLEYKNKQWLKKHHLTTN